MVRVFSRKDASEFVVEQTVDEPLPPMMEEIAEIAPQTIPHGCASEQGLQQMVAQVTKQLSELKSSIIGAEREAAARPVRVAELDTLKEFY